ncbi:MAG: ribonuclease PH [Opitutales bacterium]|nr:ribonuclease PH [Opitutales bacterium]
MRHDGRAADQLRTISIKAGIAPHATGSALCSFGDTQVICAATVEHRVPPWMRAQNVAGGWITAEYSMLPYSTLDRKRRDVSKGKQDGRTVEIQRLIGRSMRAILDLKKIPGLTIWIDCDVLRADGGTRTASITGAYVALRLAIKKLLKEKKIAEDPLTDSVAAVSVGIVNGKAALDLDYIEDSTADVDSNIVMTGGGRYVEVQGTGEENTFSGRQLQEILKLAQKGAEELTVLQKKVTKDK